MNATGKLKLEVMTIDEMWQLHEEISQILSVRLNAEKWELEKRLAQLRSEKDPRPAGSADEGVVKGHPRGRRQYPQVLPKYRNPNEPSETWSGRGKQPRWLTAALKAGHSIDEFVINDEQLVKEKRPPGLS